jgi:hypothetical protein
MASSTPWAILLCKFKDIAAEPRPKSFFEDLFCAQGAGMGGMVDYWQQISYGAADVAGSTVFGWFQLDHTFQQDKTLNRFDRILEGIEAASGTVNFDPFHGIVVILNAANIDMGAAQIGGVGLSLPSSFLPKPYGLVVLDATPTVWSPSAAAHEMGHGYGLPHSWAAMPDPVEYGDPWDIMSYSPSSYTFAGPNFAPSGPGLNAPYLQSLSWLDENRVDVITPSDSYSYAVNHELVLAALGHPEVQGYLAGRVDVVDPNGNPATYMIEFRHRSRWDTGIPDDAVLIHEVADLSYLKAYLSAGDQYMIETYGFGVFVEEINSPARTATVLIGKNPELLLDGSVTTHDTSIQGSGIFHFDGSFFPKACPTKDYAYTRQYQWQRGSFQGHPKLFDLETLEYEWYLEGNLLDPSAESIVVSVVSQSALPPPSGELTYNYEATVSYTIDGPNVELRNDPADANYPLSLMLRATDGAGRQAVVSTVLEFWGDALVFEPDYYADMDQCMTSFHGFLQKQTFKRKYPKRRDPGPLSPELEAKIAVVVHEIVHEQPELSDELRRLLGSLSGIGLKHFKGPKNAGASG